MANIIPFEERLRKQKEEVLTKEKKKRLEFFRMAMQCTACQLKCAKCGSQLEVPEARMVSDFLPLKLCQACGEEYRLYQKISEGSLPVEGREYFHNQDWLGVWKTWLEYQMQLQRYRHSKEFLKLIGELTQEES